MELHVINAISLDVRGCIFEGAGYNISILL